MDILDIYKVNDLEIIQFSYDTEVKEDRVKIKPTKYYDRNQAKDISPKNKSKYPGYGMLMGTKINNKYLIGLDIDNKEDNEKDSKNGLIFMKKLKLKQYFNKTPTQKTKNGGYHIIFSVTEEQIKNLPVSRTGLILDDVHYNVDVKFKNFDKIHLNI